MKTDNIFVNSMRLAVVMLLLVISAYGQSVEKSETSQQAQRSEDELELARKAVTKSDEKPEPPKTGRIWGDYTVISSIEIGHRFVDTGGSRSFYLSDVNVRDGWRLLDFSMDARSISGQAPLFDFMRTDFSNLGGDQGQYMSMRVDKTRAYRFDATVRRFNFFRGLPEFIEGAHNFDFRQQFSDFNLKLFPQRKVRFNLGYGRSGAKGGFFSTYDIDRDEFEIEGDTRWHANDYRFGADVSLGRWDIFFEQLFRYFKDDSVSFQRTGFNPGTPTAPSTLTSFLRDEPARSRTAVSTLNIRGDITDRAQLVLRALYSDADLDVVQIETTSGSDFIGNKILSRRILSRGQVTRPSTQADGIFTYDITDRLTLSNSFRFVSYRITGELDALTRSQLQNPNGVISNPQVILFDRRLTSLKSYQNTLMASYSFGRKLAVNAGVRSVVRDVVIAKFKKPDEKESQTTNTFISGVRFRPSQRASIFFDYQDGSANTSFVRTAPLEFRQGRVRVSVDATDKVSFNFTFAASDRRNPTPFVDNDSELRSIGAAAEWRPNNRVYLAGGYDYFDLFSRARISFFINSVPKSGRSFYYAKQDSVFVDTRLAITNRLDLLLTYRYTGDRGEPDKKPFVLTANDLINTLPLKRHNPEFRVAYRFTNNITGNVSYRHYSYNEAHGFLQDYRANILTTSVRLSF